MRGPGATSRGRLCPLFSVSKASTKASTTDCRVVNRWSSEGDSNASNRPKYHDPVGLSIGGVSKLLTRQHTRSGNGGNRFPNPSKRNEARPTLCSPVAAVATSATARCPCAVLLLRRWRGIGFAIALAPDANQAGHVVGRSRRARAPAARTVASVVAGCPFAGSAREQRQHAASRPRRSGGFRPRRPCAMLARCVLRDSCLVAKLERSLLRPLSGSTWQRTASGRPPRGRGRRGPPRQPAGARSRRAGPWLSPVRACPGFRQYTGSGNDNNGSAHTFSQKRS